MLRKVINIREYFSKLQVPDDWSDVESFMQWYMDSRMPILPPWNAQVIASDDATAITLFRKGKYQVELYLIHPDIAVPQHSHPGMESVIVYLGGGEQGYRDEFGISTRWGEITPVLYSGDIHGGRELGVSPKGYAMLTFEKWPDDIEPTSAAILWCGNTAGPKQDKLISSKYPNAVQFPGFADITIPEAKSVM